MAERMIGLTWQLWQSIRFPMWHNPIFQYGRRASTEYNRFDGIKRLVQAIFIVSVIAIAIVFPTVAFISFIALILGIPTLLIAFSGTVLGSIWVGDIAVQLASIRRDTRFDLIKMTQLGSLSISWYLSLGIIYQHDWLRRINTIVRWVVTVVLVLLVVAALMLLIGLITTNNDALQSQQIAVLRDVMIMSIVAMFLWVDHLQSIVIAHLLGLLMPTIITDSIVIRGAAPMMYLGIQMMTYLIAAIVFLIWQLVLSALLGSTVITFLATMIISLISFFIMREALMSVFMRLLLMRYDASVSDVQYLLSHSAQS